ncbi:MAG: class A beta-lactamase, subclass A2 [Ignavibacteria bacterium]
MKKYIILLVLLLSVTNTYSQIDLLRSKIESILSGKRAKVGVAISSLDTKDTLTVNGNERLVMQSVFKFHIALAVMYLVEEGKLSLSQEVFVSKSELMPNTWSPLRDKYPDGNVKVSLDEILRYTVAQSDNNGCDILLKLVGGTSRVNDFIHSIGVNDVSISKTEEEMHKGVEAQFANWTTPIAASMLLDKFSYTYAQNKSLSHLWQIMTETTTGPKRLKGLLPEGTIIAHKTGSSDTNNEGMTYAVNDIGIVVLPDGRKYSIAVFVTNSYESYDDSEKIITDISKATYDYFLDKSSK